ncbi:hypothetical protein PLESTB_000785100 [Pleodorina starrii]|uniref:Mitochondrial proton/calcium exchanger protein n=1 Tax=Pleodorina starrii TaxID=330485 RepID=A0A9W6BLH9_9CHLO|nr:hypothetical protein PLESTM_000499800 [Pleodorina starrii]GLC53767.1 hypothetical protein PLESTB_000785100 [Pleodorina starrii]GLC72947.1 hypothetical protein PLESTF_001312800 [Pleodorina starrii]
MALSRRSQPVWVLLGVTRHQGLSSKVDLHELRFVQPWALVELLSISTTADTQRNRKEQSVIPPQQLERLRLVPPIVLASIAGRSRGIHTTRSPNWPFQPTPPGLFSDSKLSKDASTGKVAAPLPKAEDCDTAIQEYDDLNGRLNQLERPASLRGVGAQLKDVAVAIGKGTVAVVRWTATVPAKIQRFRSMSKEEWQAKKSAMWKNVKHEAHHYWVGFKLLAYEVRLASGYALKAARGQTLTRRERRQLTRTTADLFRLVPLVIIVVIPFLEFALPVLLRLFPNMLPSTFEDKLKKEEEMKRRLGIKLELAKFLQDTVSEMAKDLQRTGKGTQAVTAVELYEFIQKIRAGAAVENHEIIRFAQLFNDALTLDNLERVQLVSMAQFVGINPFGTDQFLKNRLRAHLQKIKHDDYEIEREGLENLTEDELRQACRARGMRAPFGEGAVAFMRRQMHDWLDLSLHRGLPSSLLLLSRAFTITASVKDVAAKKDLAYEKLKETLSVIPEEVVESVEYEALGGPAGPKALEKKLEFLKREEELIKEEAAAAKAEEAKAMAAAAAAVPEAAPTLTAAAAAGATSTLAAVAAEARAAAAAGAAAADAAAGAAPAATAAGTAAPGVAEAAQATAAAALGAALKPELEAALTVEALSDEEKAEKASAAREARVAAILEALLSLASSSAVARERQVFMDLVRNEMDRLQKTYVEKSGATSSMAFSSAGLQVAAGTDGGAAGAEPGAAGGAAAAHGAPAAGAGASKRLGARVTKLLHSIEQELDKVESSIGDRLKLLDTDRDGLVSRQELEAAISFLRKQLDPSDMELLFQKLGAAAADPSVPIKVDELLALADENRAAAAKAAAEASSPGSPAGKSSAPAAGKSEKDPVTAEVVKIHTM